MSESASNVVRAPVPPDHKHVWCAPAWNEKGYMQELQCACGATRPQGVSMEQYAKLAELLIIAAHPVLQGQLVVKMDKHFDYTFRARKREADHIHVLFGLGPWHPRFAQTIKECGEACMQIRHGVNYIEARGTLKEEE